MTLEPDVKVPHPAKYGTPHCPECGYKCGCCCFCDCQTPCPEPCNSCPEIGPHCVCGANCHGGHDPWDCASFSTRYAWAKAKSARLAAEAAEAAEAVHKGAS